MKQILIPLPPNPDDGQYKGQPLAFNRAMFRWANETKGRIEQASHFNDIPMDQPFTLGSYTLTTSLTGTDTTSNFLASLVAAMTRKGLISPNPTGGQT